jgi:hypothetical protein
MSTAQLRQKVKRTVDVLSGEQLKAADRLLRRLREEDEDAATSELLRIPGFVQSFKRGLSDLSAGRVTPAAKLRRKR